MPYLNIDDGELDNPKIESLSDAAYRLYSMARLYCARNLTDGHVPMTKLRRLTATATDVVITELERAELLHLGDGCDDSRTCLAAPQGYAAVHDYLEWNHSKSWWLKRRQRERERKDEYRRKRAAQRVPGGVPVGQDAGQPPSGDV